ncbi:hypothetical protein BJ170DRAFT_595384 [Xylariales sp. AK1849]|nr:hypothetical protein BJ170DRAFT_595384 [Xylariales sp. AK1849]
MAALYNPPQYPFTGFTGQPNALPKLNQAQATSVAKFVLSMSKHISHHSRPTLTDTIKCLNAYSVHTPQRIGRGIWAYVHKVVTWMPEFTAGAMGGVVLPDIRITQAVGNDLNRPWVNVSTAPFRNRYFNNQAPRYRLYIFIHKHTEAQNYTGPFTKYSMTVFDRETGDRAWYSFSLTVLPGVISMRWKQFRSLHEVEDFSHELIDRVNVTMFSAMGVVLDHINKIYHTGPGGAPASIPIRDDLNTTSGMGVSLLPKLAEFCFYLLYQQNPATLRLTNLPGNALAGAPLGTWFHDGLWCLNSLSCPRNSLIHRRRLRWRLILRQLGGVYAPWVLGALP